MNSIDSNNVDVLITESVLTIDQEKLRKQKLISPIMLILKEKSLI
jgi:hypothetical protein